MRPGFKRAAAVALAGGALLVASLGGGTSKAAPPTFAVTEYGATADDAGNDTAAFQAALDAAAGQGTAANPAIVTAPAGTWRVMGLRLRSNVTLRLAAGAVVRQSGNAPGPMILANEIENARLQGTDGRFVLDLDAAATGGSPNVIGVLVEHATDTAISNIDIRMNADRLDGTAPDNQHAAIIVKAVVTGMLPTRVTLRNVHATGAPYGYGPDQVSAGRDLAFVNVTSDGGSAVRLETDGGVSRGVHGVTVDRPGCTNGNAAFTMVPHGAPSDGVHVTNVSAVNCYEGSKIRSGPLSDITIDGEAVVKGDSAQLPKGHAYLQAWVIGASVGCHINEANTATITGATCS